MILDRNSLMNTFFEEVKHIMQFLQIIWLESLGVFWIRVRIDPPHLLVCRKWRLNGAVLRMRPEKPRSRAIADVAR
jgi:hypothetical protein